MTNLSKKEKKLAKILKKYGKLAIAFSGGFDSSFLAKFAAKILGKDNILLLHASSPFSASRDKKSLAKFAKSNNIQIKIIKFNPLKNKNIKRNTENRCFHCKLNFMAKLIESAKKSGFANLADGSNTDDLNEYRPGFKACKKLGIVHPLLEAKLSKNDLKKIAKKRKFNISFAPTSSCLATRIPHGNTITLKDLKKVDAAEEILCKLRILSPRVRISKEKALIEVLSQDFTTIMKNRKKILEKLKSLGFKKIYLDLNGYQKQTKLTT